MRLLGLAGSFREGSFDRGLLRAAAELTPEGVELVEFDLRGLPFTTAISRLPAIPIGHRPEGGDPGRRWSRDRDSRVQPRPAGGAQERDRLGLAPRARVAARRQARGDHGRDDGLRRTARAQQQLREALEFPGAVVLQQPRCSSPRRTWASTSTANSSMSKPARRSGSCSPSSLAPWLVAA